MRLLLRHCCDVRHLCEAQLQCVQAALGSTAAAALPPRRLPWPPAAPHSHAPLQQPHQLGMTSPGPSRVAAPRPSPQLVLPAHARPHARHGPSDAASASHACRALHYSANASQAHSTSGSAPAAQQHHGHVQRAVPAAAAAAPLAAAAAPASASLPSGLLGSLPGGLGSLFVVRPPPAKPVGRPRPAGADVQIDLAALAAALREHRASVSTVAAAVEGDEPAAAAAAGRIDVLTGPMFAGKSTALLRRVRWGGCCWAVCVRGACGCACGSADIKRGWNEEEEIDWGVAGLSQSYNQRLVLHTRLPTQPLTSPVQSSPPLQTPCCCKRASGEAGEGRGCRCDSGQERG